MIREPRLRMPIAEIRERLDRLQDHGFISAWREADGWFQVEVPEPTYWFSRTEIAAWIDGANSMGAAP